MRISLDEGCGVFKQQKNLCVAPCVLFFSVSSVVKMVVGGSEWDERWMRIILALREEDKLNCKELSKRTKIGRGALHKVLDTLEDKKKIIQGYRYGISTIYELWPHYKK